MPELPEVETVVRGLEPVLLGRRFVHVEARRPDLRRPLPPDLAERLVGARVTALGRRGKYGLVHTDRALVMLFHLGMSGRLRLDAPDDGPHDHVVFRTDAGRRIAFTDARRFGSIDLVAPEELPLHPGLAALGPEPLACGFSAKYLQSVCVARVAPIKALLLDQRVVAGIGNIYASEGLHGAGVHPMRPAGTLSRRELAGLVRALKSVLAAAIAAGGSSLRDYVQVDGALGLFQHQWRVYGREGQPCSGCGATIVRMVQSGRSSFLCEGCQR